MGGPVPNPLKVIKKAGNVATDVVNTVVVDPAKKLLKVTEKVVGTGLKVTEGVLKAGGDVIENVTKPVVGAVGDAVQGVMGAIMPTPQIPEMPLAADAGASAAETRSNQALIERDRADKLRRRRGRAATQLVQPSISAVPTGSVATKSLLGQ